MLYTIQEFCHYVESDLNALIEEVAGISRPVTDTEKKAYRGSYPVVATMLTKAMKKNPSLADVHISTIQLALEYKLPSASAWCDLVLLGENDNGKDEVIVIELKNYLKNNDDAPGDYEGLMRHKGEIIKHPADQVKGYTEYCRRFHSVVQECDAEVNGLVYFTQPIDLVPYQAYPNHQLTQEYPLYNTKSTDELSDFICSKIKKGNEPFATKFVNGYYQQDRNILKQVALNLQAKRESEKPFVLLDEQRLGFNLVMSILQKRMNDQKKEVIIVEGPPGSGKSAVAVNLWIEAALKSSKEGRGNVVFVSTTDSQGDNWKTIFTKTSKEYSAYAMVLKSNKYNPGFGGKEAKEILYPVFSKKDSKYIRVKEQQSLKYEYYEEYLQYMLDHHMTKDYKDNLHFVSIVDEAHALINPDKETFHTNKNGGWCFQMGPQAYHIIRKSQISVFLTDGKQSFRDNETTSTEDIEFLAKKLGANVTKVSLEGMQFRCAGSVDYVNWVDHLFSKNPLKNHSLWKDKFSIDIVDYPCEMENRLRGHLANGDNSCRILSSYTKEWVSRDLLDPMHENNAPFDFDIEDKGNNRWKRYWNNPARYDIFVQASLGSKMHENPLCEVGCPYSCRGFDFNHIGMLWLDDIFYRDGKWYISTNGYKESANSCTISGAKEEQKDAIRKKIIKGKMKDIDIVPTDDERFPCAMELFSTITQAYRILMTRAIKSLTIYIKDPETREYVRSLLK